MKSKTKTLPTDAVLRDMLKQAGLDSAGVQFRLLGDGMFNAVFAAETNPPVVMKIAPRPQVPVMTYERDMLATELYWYDQIRQHTEITVPDILYSDPAGNLCGAPWVVWSDCPGCTETSARCQVRRNTGARRRWWRRSIMCSAPATVMCKMDCMRTGRTLTFL